MSQISPENSLAVRKIINKHTTSADLWAELLIQFGLPIQGTRHKI